MRSDNMKIQTTILSGGKTHELFAQLNKANPTKVADARSNYAGVTFRLRYAYVRETYGHGNFGSKVRYILTGGMVLTYSMENIPTAYSTIDTGSVRIKPDTDTKQQKAVSRAITRIIRIASNERTRIWHVQQLDKIVNPFVPDDEFLAFVEKWEKKDGKTSDYTSLTREDCERWTDRVKNYKKPAYDPKNSFINEFVEPQHQVEGTLANFDRYIAGDR